MPGETTTVTRKGQITIPVAVRRALGLREGDLVAVERQGETVILRRAGQVAERTAGMLSAYRRTPPLTPDAERAAFERAVAEEVAGTGPA